MMKHIENLTNYNTVKLQGIYGQQPGTPTKNLKIGDVIVWNYGYKSEVVEIHPSKTGKTINFISAALIVEKSTPEKWGQKD